MARKSSVGDCPLPPNGLGVLGLLIRALDITRDAPAAAKCVLAAKTPRRGFRGECRTRRWCCPLSAFLESVLEHDLIQAPEVFGRKRSALRTALFVPFGIDLACWNAIVASGQATPLLAHFRYAAVTTACRVGLLLSLTKRSPPSFLSEHANWSNPTLRAEPLRKLLLAEGLTQQALAQKLGVDADRVTSWLSGVTPRARLLNLFGGLGKRMKRDSLGRDLRWHYALSQLTGQASKQFGSETVAQTVEVSCSLALCGAAQESDALDEATRMRLQATALGQLHSAMPIEGVAAHALRHGASQAFVQDLMKANAVWRNTLLVNGQAGELAEIDFLMKHLPTRTNP